MVFEIEFKKASPKVKTDSLSKSLKKGNEINVKEEWWKEVFSANFLNLFLEFLLLLIIFYLLLRFFKLLLRKN